MLKKTKIMLMKFSFKIKIHCLTATIATIFILLASHELYAKEDIKPTANNSSDYVILIHGVTRHKFSMLEYKTIFDRLGYQAHIVDYQGDKYPISKIYNIVNKKITNIIKDKNKKVNFVGASLGGILARMVLEYNPPLNIGRVVQISPPNKGSEFADNLIGSSHSEELFGPAIYQLGSGENGIHNLLSPIKGYELGVIAGDNKIDDSWIHDISGDNDGVISIENTKVEGMKEHYIIHDNHKKIANNKETISKTVKFITEGTFYGF